MRCAAPLLVLDFFQKASMSADKHQKTPPSVIEESPRSTDAVIEEYKKDVDRSLLRANLQLTPEQRLLNLQAFIEAMGELRLAVKAARQ